MIGRILPVILIVLAIGIFVLYINPVYSKTVLPLQAKIKQYDSTLRAADEFNRKEAQLATERNAIPADAIARLMAFLPDGVDNIQLILDLNSLAGRTGLRLSDFNVDAPDDFQGNQSSGELPLEEAGSKTESLDISVRATGTYESFRTFLAGVEQSLRPMDLVQFALTSSVNGVYTYDLTFRIYWLQ